MLVTHFFCTFAILAAVPGSPALSLLFTPLPPDPPPPHGLGPHLLWILIDVSDFDSALPVLYSNNLSPLPHPYLGAVMSVPF